MRFLPSSSFVAVPGTDFAAAAVGPQHGDDQVWRFFIKHLGAIVVGTRHKRFLEPGLPQYLYRFGRREHVPDVMAVVDMGIGERDLRLHAGCRERQPYDHGRRRKDRLECVSSHRRISSGSAFGLCSYFSPSGRIPTHRRSLKGEMARTIAGPGQ